VRAILRGIPSAGLAVVGLGAAVAATFLQALLGAGVLFQRDILAYWYPGMTAFRQAVAEGAWPLWSPHLGFGAPLLADASFQLAYPPTWLALLLPLPAYYALFAASHCLWAGLGARVLARRLGADALAATAAGGAFALSGPLLSAASLFHHYAGASWMPWVLAALVGLVRRPGAASALALSLAAGAQLLAGSGDLCLGTAVAGAAGLAWHVARTRPPGLRLVAGWSAVALAVAVALGCVQWLPTLGQALSGARAAQGAGAGAGYWSLHPASLADLAVPRLLSGLDLTTEARAVLFEGRGPLLGVLYLGVPTLVLAALALAVGPSGARPVGALAAFFVVASLGRHTPLHDVLVALPGFGVMRYPQKHLLAASLAVALVAGAGVQAWLAPWGSTLRRRAWLAGGALVAAGGLLLAAGLSLASGWGPLGGLVAADGPGSPGTGPAAARLARTALLLAAMGPLVAWRATRERAPLPATALLLLALFGDLVAVGRSVNPLGPPDLVAFRPPVVDALLPFAPQTRVQHAPPDPGCERVTGGPPGWSPVARAARAAVEVVRPPTGGRFGLFGSYDGEFTGLEPRWLGPVTAAAWRLARSPAGSRLQQVGNVGHVLFLGHAPPEGPRPLGRFETAHACPLLVLPVDDPLPRAYAVSGERRLDAETEPVSAMLDPAFDPECEVLLPDARPGSRPGRAGTARVVSRRADQVVVEASLDVPGVLVLVEAFDPGWRAVVGDSPAPVLRANVMFRGVRLPQGRHLVRFSYRPREAAAGLGLGTAGLLGLVALAWRARRRLPARAGAGSIAPQEERP
jgi:hypothetical protein